MKPQQARQLAFRLCTAVSLALAVAILGRAVALPYALERALWLTRASGYIALGALFLSLSMTPMQRLCSRLASGGPSTALWLALRRSWGITAAIWALVHAAWTLATYLEESWIAVLRWPYLRAGLVTLAILLALLATSFPQLVARLRLRLWKPLHRLAYIAALFLFQHLILSPFAPRLQTFGLFATLLAVSTFRLLRPGPRQRLHHLR